ncbi:MAG: hypothetical protein E4H14_10850 [Candidatus Thorarchaeota archaeon]|nr:MAG: hypothetical protein E4H14_10850 [Candidatus Thorarchaeota archaeon]
MLEEPPDFIGNILAKLLNRQLQNPSLRKRIEDWRMSAVLETDYYPVCLIFGQAVSIQTDTIDSPTLVLSMNFGTIIKLVEGETTMIRAMLRGSIKIKGFFRNLRSVYRFYSLMNLILKG